MTRKMLTASLVVVAVLLSVLSLGGVTEPAEAQGFPECPYNLALRNFVTGGAGCADAQLYPGPFTNAPTTPGGPYGWGTLNPVAGAAAGGDGGATTGGTGGGLAHTGGESAVLGYLGTGLVAFGAVALGSRRKFFQGALDN